MNRIVALIAVIVGVGGYFLYSSMQSSGPTAQEQAQAERLLGQRRHGGREEGRKEQQG